MAEATTSDSAELSVDDAASLLRPSADQPAPEAAEPEEPEDDIEGEADAPAEPDEGLDPEAPPPEEEPEPEEEPALPAIDPPVSWDADGKALFAQLPRGVQEKVLTRETQRDAAIVQAQQHTADVRKAAEADTAQNQRYRQALDQLIPQAVETFKGKWDGIDWASWAQEDPTACYQAEKAYAAEQLQLQQLQAAQQIGQETAYREFVQAESDKLPQLAPDLADPVKAPELRRQLTGFLTDMGIAPADLKWAGAAHLAIAYDAYRYRQLQAQATASLTSRPTTPTPPAAASPRPVRPSTTPQPGSSRIRERDKAFNRLSQTQSVDDAMAALRASRKATG